MKLNCIVDTCTYINLNQIEYNKGTVLDLLHKELKVGFSSQVNGEIARHYKRAMPSYLKRNNYILKAQKFTLKEYQKKMFGSSYNVNTNNSGEKDNYIVCFDQMNHFKSIGVVYLSDDETAKRGVLKEWIDAIPTISTWSSHDLIVYLYAFDNKYLTKELALSLITDVDAQIYPFPAMESEEVKAKKMTEKQKRILEYKKKIETISKIYS